MIWKYWHFSNKYTLVQAEFRNKVGEQGALQSILLKLEINENFSLIWRYIYWENIKDWIVINFVFGNVVILAGMLIRSIERSARVCRVKQTVLHCLYFILVILPRINFFFKFSISERIVTEKSGQVLVFFKTYCGLS